MRAGGLLTKATKCSTPRSWAARIIHMALASRRPVILTGGDFKRLGPPPEILDILTIAPADVVAVEGQANALLVIKQKSATRFRFSSVPTADILRPPGAGCAKPFDGLLSEHPGEW